MFSRENRRKSLAISSDGSSGPARNKSPAATRNGNTFHFLATAAGSERVACRAHGVRTREAEGQSLLDAERFV